MTSVRQQRASFGQANGPEVELVVSGNPLYATYETLDGFAAINDDDIGLYCYARVVDGRFVSTGVPVDQPPPEGVMAHARESDEVRTEKSRERATRRALQTHQPTAQPGKDTKP
jgi:hypothetical protein